jgi:carboxymethylenebutenolidase
VKVQSEKVAVMGFCMGGALTILATVHVGELDATVCWYGIPPDNAADTRTIKIPVQCHFAQEDSYFPPAQADALRARFREGNVPHEIFSYGAKHAFGNETGENHNPEAAKLAWERTLEFLRKHLAHT